MNPLPPLQTVRKTPPPGGSPEDAPPAQTPAPRPANPEPPAEPALLDHPHLPPVARRLLGEIVRLGLLPPERLADFLQRLGPRQRELTTPDRVADALVGLHALTRYVVTRVLGGQTHGLVLGQYRVLDRLNSGSVGVVFRAEHTFLKREVAIKALPLDDATPPIVIERFQRESRLLASLSHPHLVPVHDAGRLVGPAGLPDFLYLVLEFVPGGDLEGHVYEHGVCPIPRACAWGRQAALALELVHAAGVEHRDIKPSNYLEDANGSIKLTDFGLARDFASTRTRPTDLVGSVEFLAPEQLADPTTAAGPADVYGLGATLFWALTGKTPYPQERKLSDAVAAIQAGPPRRLKEFLPDAPDALDSLMARMLARTPGGRPTAAQAAAELAAFADPMDATADQAGHLRQVLTHAQRQADAARRAVLSTLALTSAARHRDADAPPGLTERQTRRAELSRTLAAQLAKGPAWASFADPRALDDLAQAAAACDLGLIAVPDEILAAEPDFLPSERHAYERHPELGDAILGELAPHADALPFLRMLRAVVRHHHERHDGGGYPDRLAGDAIPRAARVVAVADAYDRLRATLPHAAALSELRARAGTHFDPAVIAELAAVGGEWERVAREHADIVGELEAVAGV